MNKFDTALNNILKEEISREDRINALKNIPSTRPFTVILVIQEIDGCEPWGEHEHVDAYDKEHAEKEAKKQYIKDTFGDEEEGEEYDEDNLGVSIQVCCVFNGHISPV